MKTRIPKKMYLIAAIVSLTLATACAPAAGSKKMDSPKKMEAKKEAPASGIVSKPGFYQDKNIGFTFTWPAKVMSVQEKPLPGEVLRWKAKQGVPVITVTVGNRTTEQIPLEDAPKHFKKTFEAMLTKSKPLGAQQFDLVEGKVTTISNGFPAAYARVNWEAGKGEHKLVTVSLTVYKNDKVIVVTCTSPQDVPPIEVLNSWVRAIKVDA